MRKEQIKLESEMSGNAMKMSIEDRKMQQESYKIQAKGEESLQKHKVRLAEQAIKQRNENARFNREIAVKERQGTGI